VWLAKDLKYSLSPLSSQFKGRRRRREKYHTDIALPFRSRTAYVFGKRDGLIEILALVTRKVHKRNESFLGFGVLIISHT